MKENISCTSPAGETSAPASGARATVTVPFLLLTVVFVVCLIISNLIEIKTIDVGWFTLTAGIAVFPVSYIINDCVVEIYGFSRARMMIWLGFAMSLLTAAFLNLAIVLPGGAGWEGQEAMETVYGAVPRIMLASFSAFICGSMVNAFVMSRMKAADRRRNRLSFSLRAIVSTLWGEGADSVVFFPIAFGGVLPWSVIFSLIVTQALLKTAYEILILPLTITVVGKLKRVEKLDAVDRDISYSWFRFG